MLDETLLSHAQGEAHAKWASEPLQARFFGRHQAGECLYEAMCEGRRESGDALYLQSQAPINLAAARRLSAHADQGISLLARQEGMRLVSGKGPLEIESHADVLNLIAQQDLTVQSVQGHLQLTAKNGITLGAAALISVLLRAGRSRSTVPAWSASRGSTGSTTPLKSCRGRCARTA